MQKKNEYLEIIVRRTAHTNKAAVYYNENSPYCLIKVGYNLSEYMTCSNYDIYLYEINLK